MRANLRWQVFTCFVGDTGEYERIHAHKDYTFQFFRLAISSSAGSNVSELTRHATTPIVMTLLEQKLPITQIVVMMQKEVAERFTATPGGKEYGAVTVAVQYFSVPELLFEVAPQSFIPEPAVTSAVVQLKLRNEKPVMLIDEDKFFAVIKAAFAQRRKTLSNNLRAYGISSEALQNLSATTQIDFSRRGETLSLQEFAALANELSK